MDNKAKRLTNRQKDFADNWIKYRNVSKAAIEAGYSRYYATSSGSQKLMNNPLIKAYIERRVSKMDARMIASQEEILYGLTKVFRREETEDVVSVVEESVPYTIKSTDKDGNVTETTKFVTQKVAKVTQVRNSVADSTKAGNDLLKIVGRTTQSKLEMAKLRKALAEAKLAERKANDDETSDVTIQIVPWEKED